MATTEVAPGQAGLPAKVVERDRVVRMKVLAGIRLLQERYGEDWVDNIDMDTLALRDVDSCVLGQLYGSWDLGIVQLGIEDMDGEYGFSDAGIAEIEERLGASRLWNELQAIWADEIQRIKAERA